ncbi:trypsin-like serine peptidase [Azospirillum soli]|uniref:trypsin-like serine peptidase n=1 Tax=Azospirillum soli TaxID=1304799 RepID=UPI001AE7609C|nr:trypsin-like peptidase domain-containing protein [Azospirillum soli]MBP2310978.1 protease YdgD [Azospirillum soli]
MKTYQERAILLLMMLVAAPAWAQKPQLPGVGADDRRVTVDAGKDPWRSLVRVQTNLAGRCTGVLVTPTRVVTAAHCLFNGRTQRYLPASSLHVLFGYAKGEYRQHVTVASFTTDPAHDPAQPAGRAMATDWAVLTLNKPAPADVPPLPLSESHPPPGMALRLGGYSQDKAQILMADTDCRALGVGQAPGGPVLVHDCAGTRGTSGAALLAERGGIWSVVGIAVAVAADSGANRRNFAVPSAVFAPVIRENAGAGQP